MCWTTSRRGSGSRRVLAPGERVCGMPTEATGTLSPLKRFAGLCGILGVIVVAGAGGYFLMNRSPADNSAPPPDAVLSVVFFVIGLVVVFAGAGLYGIVLA